MPVIAAVEIGFYTPETVNWIMDPAASSDEKPSITVRTSLTKVHFSAASMLAVELQLKEPWITESNSLAKIALGFHFGKVTLILPPAGITWAVSIPKSTALSAPTLLT